MNAIVIDDDSKNIRILRKMVEEFCPEVNIIGDAGNSREGHDLIKALKPDLVFLDIEMPYGNAFELLDSLLPVNFEIIFITAFDEYSLKAFRYSAIDYLLKPIDIDELQSAVSKAMKKHKLKDTNLQLTTLLSNLSQEKPALKKLAIPTQEGLVFIEISKIIRCQASQNYTYIYIDGGEKLIVSKNILEYEELLPKDIFFRIHHSHIINLNYVTRYQKGRGGSVVLEDGSVIEVAVRRKDEFLARFNT